jgi:hypothetical protein
MTPRALIVAAFLSLVTGTGCGQAAAWQAGGAACLASPAATRTMDPATGCPSAIDTSGPDFAAADAVLRAPGSPHRYELDPATTRSERRTHPGACCYQLRYPPPPPPPPG